MSNDAFHERVPLAEPDKPGLTTWLVRIGAGIVVLVGVFFVGRTLMVEPSWHRAGFATDPGEFVRKQTVDYPVCAPWNGWRAAGALPAGHKLTTATAQPLPKRDEVSNLGILLPTSSHIVAIYCGSVSGAAVEECSLDGCAAPVIVQLDDDIHTKQRALSVSLVGKDAAPKPDQALRIWVLWKP